MTVRAVIVNRVSCGNTLGGYPGITAATVANVASVLRYIFFMAHLIPAGRGDVVHQNFDRHPPATVVAGRRAAWGRATPTGRRRAGLGGRAHDPEALGARRLQGLCLLTLASGFQHAAEVHDPQCGRERWQAEGDTIEALEVVQPFRVGSCVRPPLLGHLPLPRRSDPVQPEIGAAPSIEPAGLAEPDPVVDLDHSVGQVDVIRGPSPDESTSSPDSLARCCIGCP